MESMFCFCPTFFASSTFKQIRIIRASCACIDSSMLVLPPIPFHMSLPQFSFPKKVGQWVTTLVSFMQYRRVFNIIPTFWSLSWMNYDHKFMDILLLAIVTIWENLSFCLDGTLQLRHLFLQQCQEALRWCPRTLPLPTATLKHHALWALSCVLLRL